MYLFLLSLLLYLWQTDEAFWVCSWCLQPRLLKTSRTSERLILRSNKWQAALINHVWRFSRRVLLSYSTNMKRHDTSIIRSHHQVTNSEKEKKNGQSYLNLPVLRSERHPVEPDIRKSKVSVFSNPSVVWCESGSDVRHAAGHTDWLTDWLRLIVHCLTVRLLQDHFTDCDQQLQSDRPTHTEIPDNIHHTPPPSNTHTHTQSVIF